MSIFDDYGMPVSPIQQAQDQIQAEMEHRWKSKPLSDDGNIGWYVLGEGGATITIGHGSTGSAVIVNNSWEGLGPMPSDAPAPQPASCKDFEAKIMAHVNGQIVSSAIDKLHAQTRSDGKPQQYELD